MAACEENRISKRTKAKEKNMTNKPENPPAFPVEEYSNGMTLRDYMAGQALVMLPHHGCGADLDTEDTALAAYQIADAMLKARES